FGDSRLCAAPSIHAGSAAIVSAAHRAACPAERHPRRAARSARDADRLSLPSALPALPAGQRRPPSSADERAAGAARDRRRALGGLSPGGRMSVLEVRDLSKTFPIGGAVRRQRVHAVEDVSFSLRPGTITALVGESGSGK